jgi:hypothetical protein
MKPLKKAPTPSNPPECWSTTLKVNASFVLPIAFDTTQPLTKESITENLEDMIAQNGIENYVDFSSLQLILPNPISPIIQTLQD